MSELDPLWQNFLGPRMCIIQRVLYLQLKREGNALLESKPWRQLFSLQVYITTEHPHPLIFEADHYRKVRRKPLATT